MHSIHITHANTVHMSHQGLPGEYIHTLHRNNTRFVSDFVSDQPNVLIHSNV
jgi:hypothetical protein